MMDRQALLSAALGVGAICATVAGTSCSTNARIDDLHANLLDFRADVRSEIQSVRNEIRDVRNELQAVRDEVQAVRDEVQDVRGLLIDHIDGHAQGSPDQGSPDD